MMPGEDQEAGWVEGDEEGAPQAVAGREAAATGSTAEGATEADWATATARPAAGE